MALHKKPSCCGVKHGLRSTSENHCHLPQSAAALRNATWISWKDSGNVCYGQMSPHFNLFLGKMDVEFSVPKTKGTIQIFICNRCKSKLLSWYGGAVEQTAWVTGICVKVPYIGIVQRHMLPSLTPFMGRPWLLDQDNARFHSVCATTAWFRRHRVNVLRLAACSPHLSSRKCMTSHEKENQTTTITDCWASEVLYQARLDKDCLLAKL